MSTYSVSARWTAARRGDVTLDNGASAMPFSAPPEFNGEDGLWTPEHFLVAAVSSCFITTFKAIADFSKFPFESLDVTADGILEQTESGYRFTRFTVRPALVVQSELGRRARKAPSREIRAGVPRLPFTLRRGHA